MTDFFVRKSGNNASAGTSAGAAWATIGKALATGSSVAAGDRVFIGAGTYREQVTLAVQGSSGSGAITVMGDVDGAQTGDAGDVVWTSYTTNDTTAPAANATCQIAGKSYLTFKQLHIIGGTGAGGNNGAAVDSSASGQDHLTFEDCVFVAMTSGSNGVAIFSAAANTAHTFKRCIFDQRAASTGAANGTGLLIYYMAQASAFDCGLIVQNCLFLIGGNAYGMQVSQAAGSGTGYAGGGNIRNCTFQGGVYGIYVSTANFQTATPLTVANCYLSTQSGADLRANTSGQISEDYNVLQGQTARTNVSAGTHSKTGNSVAPLFNYGQEYMQGRQARPFMVPLVTRKAGVVDVVSPLLGFGSDGSHPSVDFRNRVRPAGGQSTSAGVGYLERHEEGQKETSVTQAGSTSLKLVGPGDHDILVPVDSGAQTLSIYARYDTNHGTGSKPQVQLLAQGELGVTLQTLTMTAAVDTWEKLTTASFTPSGKGVVTLRCISRSAAGGGIAYFDSVAT